MSPSAPNEDAQDIVAPGAAAPSLSAFYTSFPWGVVLRQLKARDIGRSFTERTLVKACRTLVAHGHADPVILERAPRLPSNDRVARLLADRLRTEPNASLRRLAGWLSHELREPTPRGGFTWSPDGVRRELERARRLGLLPEATEDATAEADAR